MTTKDEALQMALDALCRTFPTGKYERELEKECRAAIAACRAALAQKDEQALHAGAAVPSEAISLSGDAKLAHDQCRAVAHLANSFAEVYAARAAIVAHDAKLSDLIGDASASAMEWLGDELNAMDSATEDDGWLDPIFEAAQKRWPQQPPRRPQKDEQEPVKFNVEIDDDAARTLAGWLGHSDSKECTYPIRLMVGEGHSGYGLYVCCAEYPEEGADLLAKLSPPPKRKPLTDAGINEIAELVAAAEREACAKTVEDMEHGNVRTCAAAIRARGNA